MSLNCVFSNKILLFEGFAKQLFWIFFVVACSEFFSYLLLWTLIMLSCDMSLAQRFPVSQIFKVPNLCKYIRVVLKH